MSVGRPDGLYCGWLVLSGGMVGIVVAALYVVGAPDLEDDAPGCSTLGTLEEPVEGDAKVLDCGVAC